MAGNGPVRLLVFCQVHRDRGSARDVLGYVEASRVLGHEVFLYGPEGAHPGLPCTDRVEDFDAAVFVVEYTSRFQHCDEARLEQILALVPRQRRVVIDCDGRYNDCIHIDGDSNHRDEAGSRAWTAMCDRLADKILQPTARPLRPNVRPFYFHGYDPAWEHPFERNGKDFDVLYVGNNWFRWRPLLRVLRAIEPVRGRLGRIGIAGHGWGAPPPWETRRLPSAASDCDPEYLRRLGCEVIAPVPFREVIPLMSRSCANLIVYRPLFDHLGLVTCRTFETPAAGTVPLFARGGALVHGIYGEVAGELVLGDDPAARILDVVRRPGHYSTLAAGLRQRLKDRFGYQRRLEELITIALE